MLVSLMSRFWPPKHEKLELQFAIWGRFAVGSKPVAQMMLFMLPESSISNITLGGTAAALNKGESEGVNAYTGADR
ncbi:hypothetical protein D3C73_789600 [compost metagenome]